MITPTTKVVLVGEHNPFGADPRYALYPLPDGSAGARLCCILRLDKVEYVCRFARKNLLTGESGVPFRWSAPRARDAANALLEDLEPGAAVVLCGRKVAEAANFQSMRNDTVTRMRAAVEALCAAHARVPQVLPTDYEPCGDCGFDHSYEHAFAGAP